MTPAELRRKAAELRDKLRKLVAAAEAENRELNEEETTVANDIRAQVDGFERRAKMQEDLGVEPNPAPAAPPTRSTEPIAIESRESEDDKIARGGQFRGLGHFASSVRRALHPSEPARDAQDLIRRYTDSAGRVTRAASGMNEGSDPDGGILVPADASRAIWDRMRDNPDNLMNAATVLPVSGNRLPIPAVDETSRANGSRWGGLQAFWVDEADQIPKTKPKFRDMDLRLKKLAALVYVTNELLDDATGLDAYLNMAVPDEIMFRINDAMLRGSGAGVPLGIFSSPVFLTVAKESGQAAASLVTQNILKMFARTYAPSRRRATWYINQDVEPQLGQLYLATGANSGQLTYLPPGGISGSAYATLQGRPVETLEQADTLGQPGDIFLADWSQYAMIYKGIKSAMSIHLRFDYDETAYRWTVRVDGQPFWSKPLTPFKGSNTLSPFVGLQAR